MILRFVLRRGWQTRSEQGYAQGNTDEERLRPWPEEKRRFMLCMGLHK
jgi:hypothetical protein